MQVVEVLNPLAREFKSIGTLRKELDGLQEELALAHNQVNLNFLIVLHIIYMKINAKYYDQNSRHCIDS